MSEPDLVRLLDLFPLKNLKEVWPDYKGTKQEICKRIAAQRELTKIADFADDYFNFCKQHIYIFGFTPTDLPRTFGAARQIKTAPGIDAHALYVARVNYTVVLSDPYAKTSLELLWPVRLDIVGTHLLVRFIVLERSVASQFTRPVIRDERNLEEEDILVPLKTGLSLTDTDLNKGVKALLANDFMDARRAQFKKTNSTSTEAMDEQRGIKKDNPEVYEQLMKAPLRVTLCVIPATKQKKELALWIDPSLGTIRFPRYAENMGDYDDVIRKILQANT